jgi:H+/gluconate symporter-like permease
MPFISDHDVRVCLMLLMSLLIRVSLSSATVAGLTAAGIMGPVVPANASVNSNLMVLAIGAVA